MINKLLSMMMSLMLVRVRTRDEVVSIPNQQVVHLNTIVSIYKRRQYVESNVIVENQSENSGDSLEIINPGGDLDDGVVKTTQNVIRDQLQKDKLVHNGNTFDLNVKQLYKPIEGQEKYQIRKPQCLHVHNLKALMRHNPYAHVVEYLVLVDPKDVLDRDAFDK